MLLTKRQADPYMHTEKFVLNEDFNACPKKKSLLVVQNFYQTDFNESPIVL